MKSILISGKALLLIAIVFSQPLFADSTAVFAGFNMEKDSDYYYAGAIYAINGDVTSTGIALKAQVGYGEYDYDTTGVVGGKVEGEQDRYNLSVGYQWVGEGLLTAIYVGADVQDHDLSPRDSLNNVDGSTDGLITHVEIETLNSPEYLAFMGNYSTAYESYWARARGGMANGENKFGLEYIAGGNASHDTDKVGLFMLLPVAEKVRLDLDLGYFETEGKNSRGDKTGSYVGVGVVTRF